jgi:hypothetical protein
MFSKISKNQVLIIMIGLLSGVIVFHILIIIKIIPYEIVWSGRLKSTNEMYVFECVSLLLGASYIYSRSLWLPIAIHFSWNFVQSGIFGATTSGNEKTSSLFKTNISGSELITGGAYGPEGTIQATIFWSLVAIILMILVSKQNKLIKPFWKK